MDINGDTGQNKTIYDGMKRYIIGSMNTICFQYEVSEGRIFTLSDHNDDNGSSFQEVPMAIEEVVPIFDKIYNA